MKVSLFLLVKKIEHLKKIFSFAIPKFKTHSKYGFGFSYQQKNPFKISLYSKLKTELKNLFKTLFLMTANHRLVSIYTALTLVGLSVSIYSLLSNEATSDFKNKASSSLVLAEQSSVEDYLITFNNETLFNQPVTFAQPIVAPNVTYSVTAGTGIRVAGDDPQNPTITNSGVLSIASLTGAIDIEAGSNIELEILNNAINIEATDQLRGKVFTISQGGTGAVNSSDARKNLGLVIDTDVQSYSTLLKNISQVTPVTSGFLTTDENQNWVMVSGAFARNRIGLGKDNEVEFKKITIGENEGLNIDSAGNFTKINGVVIRFPSVQGALNSVLLNDGAGNLIWTDSTGSGSIGYFSRNNLTATLSTSNAGDSLNLGTGSLIMSGSITTSGIISGTGSGLTNLNASNISSGTIPFASVVGTYANITGVGTLSSGTWQGAPVADTYIQSAVNWNTAYSNRITSLTTSGSSGASTLTSNTLNIPTYTLAGLGGQPQLNGTGFVKISGTAISYDANTYLTGNQTITLSGDVTGSGATAITTTIGDGKVTNTMLAGSIANNKLSNSSITIGSTSVSLGSSITALSDITSLSVNGIISGTGSGLTNLNASNISSGTIPVASVVGTYANITGVGTLSSLNVTGAITSGDITSSNIISGTSFRGGLGSISAPTFSFTADTDTGIFSPSADILGFVTSGTEQMTILSSGNVGIGTTNPSSKLEVVGQLLASGASGFIQSSNQIIAPRGLLGMGSGTLTSSGTAQTGSNPTSVTVDPLGRFVYVANSDSNTVSSYTINQTTGTLTSSGTAPAGTNPRSVTVDPSGKFVYVANSGSGTVSSYTINQTTGTLTSSGSAPTGAVPNSVTVDPSGRFVYVANQGSNAVSSYTINQTTGTLTSSGTAPTTGWGPYSVNVDPSGRFVYATNSGSGTVSSYTINQINGTLTSSGTAPTGSGPYSVNVDPSGRFVYVANNLGTVSSYTINQATGTLISSGTAQTGANPSSVTVDPSGRFAYVTNFSHGNVSSYTINQATGTLISSGTTPTGTYPNSVTVDPSGEFVYVVNSGNSTVSSYTINNFSAGSAFFAGNVGIGTTNPGAKLDVYGSGITNQLKVSGSGSTVNTYLGTFVDSTYFTNNYYYDGSHKSDNAAKKSSELSFDQDGFYFNTMPAGSPGTRTRLFTILSGGNVGIGTTNPAVALQVVGAITASGIISGTGSGLTNLNASNISSGTIPAASVLNISGNAATATSLASTRTIWGQSFNGTANITGDLTGVTSITASNIISGTSFRGGLGSISAPTFSFTSDPNTGIFSRTDILGLVTSGTEQMTILSSGNVGIGTTNPQSKLNVEYNSSDAGFRLINSISRSPILGGGLLRLGQGGTDYLLTNDRLGGITFSGVYDTNGNSTESAGIFAYADENWSMGGVGTRLEFQTTSPWLTNASTKMTILGSGSVGIGTTNPTVALQVVGNITSSGIISGTGSGLTNLNASNISSGTIPAASVVGAYANITGVGTLSSLNVTGAITSGDITSSGIISGTSFRGGLGSISAPTFSFTSDPNTGIFSPSADILGFVTSGTERMRIDPSGNVGIGTTNPSTMLDIFGTSSALQLSYDANDYARFSIASDGKLTLAGVSSGGSLTNIANFSTTQANFDVPTSFNSVGDISVAYDINLSNQTASNIKSDGPLTISSGEVFENLDLTLRTYGSGKFVVNSRNFWSDGDRVGIGTTNPGVKLDVRVEALDSTPGSVLSSYPVARFIVNGSSGTRGLELGAPTGGLFSPVYLKVFGTANRFAILNESNAENFTILNNGNVGIGTTNPDADRLHVLGNIRVGTSGTDGCIKNFGGVGIAGTCSSDQSLKKDITSLSSVLDRFVQLNPVSFKFRADTFPEYGFGTDTSIGLIAQQVESLFPEFIGIDDKGFKTVNYGIGLQMYTIKAIQEQQLQISGISSNLSTLTEELDLKLNEETGEIVSSISSLINSTSATNDLINLNQTANITTITALDSRVEVLENYSLDISDFQASASATLSELNQRIGLFEQIMSLTSTDSATLSASSALESLIDSRILGAFTSQIATFSALTVTSGANINNLAVTGNMTNGLLTINGFDDSLATPSATLSTLSGPLKIQHQALGEIDFMGGKAIIDTNGDFKIITGDFEISSGVIKGNNQFRGFDLSITPNSLEVDVIFETNRLSNEYTVSVLPSWLTNVAIIQKRTDGFKIKFSNPAPVDAKIDWLIIE